MHGGISPNFNQRMRSKKEGLVPRKENKVLISEIEPTLTASSLDNACIFMSALLIVQYRVSGGLQLPRTADNPPAPYSKATPYSSCTPINQEVFERVE